MDVPIKAMISLLPEEGQDYTMGMYETVEDVYDVNPMNLINKGNLLKGLSELLWKRTIGEEPDELAKEVMKTSLRHYYYPPNTWNRETKYNDKQIEDKNNYAISLLESYQNQYGIVTDRGVEIIKDMIKNNLLSQQYQEARKYIKNIEPGDEFNFKWDLGKGSTKPDITDIIHAIHGTDYNREKESQ
jgi:hypothetical protein